MLLRMVEKGMALMRSLEWVVLLSFVPIVLLPFVPQMWRRWLSIAAPLPALACVVQVFVEGWRIQMAPLYVLAALVLAARLPALLGRVGTVSRARDVLASGATALIVVLGGVLAGWLLPVFTLPAPTGPYRVGIVDRELVDEARGRRLMTSVWYPAAEGGTEAPLTHNPDEVMTALGDLTGLPAPLFQHLRYVTLAAHEGAPVLADSPQFPVLVFSHGLVGMRLQNSSTLQELASWGYVVVALDHTDAAAVTVFPDGEARYYDAERFGIPAGVEPTKALVNDRIFPVWVADQRFIYDSLEAWEADDPMLAGRLDLSRIGSFGHSFGGATALDVCLVDARCDAAVDMDGGLYGESETLPAVRPLLLMSSAESVQYPEAVESWSSLIARATDAAYWLELPNSSHLSFTFSQLLSPLLAPPGFDPREGLLTVDTYLRAFFDRYLREMETLPLGPASGATDVRWLAE
jgi:predicted dienelactone hydrolase